LGAGLLGCHPEPAAGSSRPGLGAVWVGVYPLEERVAGLKQVLGLPEQVVPLCVVPIGYPANRPEPPERRYDESRLHHNHW